MLNKLKNINFLQDNKIAGVHLTILPDESYAIDIAILKRKKTLIYLEKNDIGISSFEEVKKIIGNIPVAFSIDGKGIIHKRIQASKGEEFISKVLPNATDKDFYSQIVDIDETDMFVSLIRKETLESILDLFQKAGNYIVYFTIGPFAINTIAKDLLSNDNVLQLKYYQLELGKKGIDKINRSNAEQIFNIDSEIKVYDESISIQSLIPYASGIAAFSQVDVGETNIEQITVSKEEYFYKKLYNGGYKIALGLFFLILIINFLIFDNYKKEEDLISSRFQQNKGLIEQLKKLEDELQNKEDLIAKSGLLFQSRFSFYADRIAQTIPNEIFLNEMNLFPLLKQTKQDKEILIEKKKIVINGVTKKVIVLNDWIKKINELDWVKDVVIKGYKQENINTSAEFTLVISIK